MLETTVDESPSGRNSKDDYEEDEWFEGYYDDQDSPDLLIAHQEDVPEALKEFQRQEDAKYGRGRTFSSAASKLVSTEEVYGKKTHREAEVNNGILGRQDNSGVQQAISALPSQEEPPEAIYQKLSKVRFSNDHSSNPQVWAGNEQISSYVNQAIGSKGISQGLAYYIAPTLAGFDSEERIEDVAELLCKRKEKNGKHSNLYGKRLDKLCIAIANTSTVHGESPTDYNKEGGAHWVGWVLLPKKYSTLSGKEISNDKYKVYFFDSLKAGRSFPEKLKQYLIKGGDISKPEECTLSLFPFCTKEEIEFIDVSHLTGQQQGMNGSDCGWWAVYYVLMTIYTGGVEFLKPLKEKHCLQCLCVR